MNVPLARSDPHTHYKIADAYASVLFERERSLVKGGKVLCIGLAQDIWLQGCYLQFGGGPSQNHIMLEARAAFRMLELA